MAIIISMANEKGGVAKTTSVASIGSVLSRKGFKTLLLDLDPQADLTISLDVEAMDRNIYDCVFNHRRILANKVNENLVLVGGDPRFNPIEFMDALKRDKEFEFENPRLILKSVLEEVKDKADFVLLDCAPNREIITQNALAASDYVLIPSEAHNFSVNGINNIIQYINGFQQKLNPNLRLLGIFLTRFRKNTAIHSDMLEWFIENYSEDLFKTVINENITLQEATQMGRELIDHQEMKNEQKLVKSKSVFTGLMNYNMLVDEILNRLDYEKRDI